MRPLLWLQESGCGDPAVVGGKVGHLSKLCRHHTIPDGFCLTAAASQQGSSDASWNFPAALAQQICDAYADLGRRLGAAAPAVAVRSSAVDEDGASSSFAGIYSTYLNVRGCDALLAAIARCWASADAPRVREYRQARGLPPAKLAVLVQQLVAADAAAVVFSQNPIGGMPDQLVINANYGLGESIVGGLATPDQWILRRADRALLRFALGPKEQMTVLSGDGTHEVPVFPTLRRRPSLTSAQVDELARLALQLEATMGWPVDIECAFRSGELYLLQCRPITTSAA